MSSVLLLCVVTYIFIHQTSPLSTGDQQQNDGADGCGRTQQVLAELVTAVSQLQQNDQALSQLVTSRLVTAVHELQAEVAELKTAIQPIPTTGTYIYADIRTGY